MKPTKILLYTDVPESQYDNEIQEVIGIAKFVWLHYALWGPSFFNRLPSVRYAAAAECLGE